MNGDELMIIMIIIRHRKCQKKITPKGEEIIKWDENENYHSTRVRQTSLMISLHPLEREKKST